jgi:Bacterial Ig-like domain (group 3)/Domain of unknown function (DUF2341)/Concanavalin A-like lectin/glucanases superfamily
MAGLPGEKGMACNLAPGRCRDRRDGISEVIGFLLILAVIIFSISLYVLYAMPAMGREDEIARMSAVKEAFTEYKLNIDTLWTSRQCTSDFGPALSLGSGETTGILGYFPFFSPPKAGAVLALNQRAENITITSDSFVAVASGGYNESGAITVAPVTMTMNQTPVHFYLNVSTTYLQTPSGVSLDGPGWDLWVNVTPNYLYFSRFNITENASHYIATQRNWTDSLWNSTDITVTTFSGSNPVNTVPVYHNITTSRNYTVDLMSPVYGISTQFQTPQSFTLSESDSSGNISGWYDLRYGYAPVVMTSTYPLGSIEFRSNNIWYTPQNYYYQLGGVFLEQPDGSTNEIPPAISISVVNGSPLVNIGDILIQGGVESTQMSGSGPITVATAVTDATAAPLPAGNNTRWVNITIQAASENASRMWQRTLTSLADQAGLPATAYTNGTSGSYAFLNITGDPNLYDIRLSLTQVNVSADYVLDYSTGGVSRYWRDVPGFSLPSNATTTSGLNATTTALGSSATYCNYGTSVTFTATVTGTGGPGTPTGTVSFYNGSTLIGSQALSSGSASISLSDLPVGTNSVTATYSGDSYYQTSTSGAVQVTIANPPAGYVAWKDCAWTHRKNITIDKKMVNGTLSNFPVLINFTADSDLAASAKSNGQDIFFTQSDGVTILPHEIELYQSGSGGLVTWVKIPSLTNTTNTSIYMYYGNPTASPQWQNTSVWDDGGSNYYQAVWHLREGGTGTRYDSTSNGNNLNTRNFTGSEGMPGMIDGANNLTGAPTDDWLESANNIGIANNAPRTVTFWVKLVNTNIASMVNWGTPSNGQEFGAGIRGNDYFLWGYGGVGTYDWDTATIAQTGGWHYHAITYDGSTPNWFVDASGIGTPPSRAYNTVNSHVYVGFENDPGMSRYNWIQDTIDEIRISNTVRSIDWIKTEYRNQNSPATFAYRMPQESSSCAPAFVQGTGTNSQSGTQLYVTLPGSSTAGNLIVLSLSIASQSYTVSTVTDTKGNTYSPAIGPTDWNAGADRSWTYYASNIAGGGSPITITATFSGTPPSGDIYAAEYSGITTSSPLDQTSSGTGLSGITLDSGSKTTTQASELIFGFGMSAGHAIVDSPYTARSTFDNNFIADRVVSSTGSYHVTATNTGANNWMCQMVTFKGK